MIKLDKVCNWLIIICLAGLLPSILIIKYLDEIASLVFLVIAIADCVLNRNYKRYIPLFILVGVMLFYLTYTLLFKSYNTTPYVLMDLVLEIKPFLPLLVIIAIRPVFSAEEKSVIKAICVINSILVLPLYFLSTYMMEQLVGNIAYCGAAAFISSLFYLFCSIKPDGSVDQKDKIIAMVLLASGLPCMKAKFLGEAVLMVFFVWFYKPMMFHGFKPQYILVALLLVMAVIAVSWNKISYYYLTGNSDTFDPKVAQSFARPVLYATAGLIIADYTLLGSGLASFASWASAINYSDLYYEYGIDKVYGLSEAMPDYICDAYFPSLAQFGLVGIILFIVFWRWIYMKQFKLLRENLTLQKFLSVTGVMCICFVFIESSSNTMFSQSGGMIVVSILGYALSRQYLLLQAEQKNETIKTLYNYGK